MPQHDPEAQSSGFDVHPWPEEIPPSGMHMRAPPQRPDRQSESIEQYIPSARCGSQKLTAPPLARAPEVQVKEEERGAAPGPQVGKHWSPQPAPHAAHASPEPQSACVAQSLAQMPRLSLSARHSPLMQLAANMQGAPSAPAAR
jgi:hypothetical protein